MIAIPVSKEHQRNQSKQQKEMDVPQLRISKTTIFAFDHQSQFTESSDESSSYVDEAMSYSSESEFLGAIAPQL